MSRLCKLWKHNSKCNSRIKINLTHPIGKVRMIPVFQTLCTINEHRSEATLQIWTLLQKPLSGYRLRPSGGKLFLPRIRHSCRRAHPAPTWTRNCLIQTWRTIKFLTMIFNQIRILARRRRVRIPEFTPSGDRTRRCMSWHEDNCLVTILRDSMIKMRRR